MKKSEIYHLINDLIQENKLQSRSKDHTKPNFVGNYYREYLRKNKLHPKNRHYRIKELMKNFEELDTYVDVTSLLRVIEERLINSQKEKENVLNVQNEKRGQRKKLTYLIERTKTQPVSSDRKFQKTRNKADKILKRQYQSGDYLELNKCSAIVKHLEGDSSEMQSLKYKNNSRKLFYHEIMNQRFIENQTSRRNMASKYKSPEDEEIEAIRAGDKGGAKANARKAKDFEEQDEDKIMNIYDQVRSPFQMEARFQENSKLEGKSLGKSKRKLNEMESSQVMRMASSYLHIILERQHKRKWAVNKVKPTNNNTGEDLINFDEMKESCQDQSQILDHPRRSLPFELLAADENTINNPDKEQEAKAGGQKDRRISNQIRKPIQFRQKIKNSNQNIEPVSFIFEANKKKTNIKELVKKRRSFRLNCQNQRRDKVMVKVPKQNLTSECIEGEGKKNQSEHFFANETMQDDAMERLPLPNISSSLSRKESILSKNSQSSHLKSSIKERNRSQDPFTKTQKSLKMQLMESFTFRNRKIKEKILDKIEGFFRDMECIEKRIMMEDKDCTDDLNYFQREMEFDYGRFMNERPYDEDKALQGMRKALTHKDNMQNSSLMKAKRGSIAPTDFNGI